MQPPSPIVTDGSKTLQDSFTLDFPKHYYSYKAKFLAKKKKEHVYRMKESSKKWEENVKREQELDT